MHLELLLGLTSIQTSSCVALTALGEGVPETDTLASPVINRKRSSSCIFWKRGAKAGGPNTVTSASIEDPKDPKARKRSSSRDTSALSAISAAQSMVGSRSAPAGNWCQVLKNTDSCSVPGKY